MTPLHFALNTLFRGTYQAEFKIPVASLYYIHYQNLGATAHQVAVAYDEGSRIVLSRGLAFVPAEIVQAVLEFGPDGVAAPISEVLCWYYSLLVRSASRAFD